MCQYNYYQTTHEYAQNTTKSENYFYPKYFWPPIFLRKCDDDTYLGDPQQKRFEPMHVALAMAIQECQHWSTGHIGTADARTY